MIGAMTAGAGATGARVRLAHRAPRRVTPRRLKAIAAALLGGALVAASVFLGGSG
jgi:hypothetical protein